jgi:hypothetical protein
VDAALVAVMLLWYPTKTGVEQWITSQRDQVEMMKQQGV